jgi:acetyl esterase
MNLDPAVQKFVDIHVGEQMDHLDVADQRRYMRLLIDLNFLRFSAPGPDVHSVTDHCVAVDGGEIRCRVYQPSDETRLPAHLVLHGGGWWQGSTDDLICDATCRQRCAEAHVVVVAVEYRLAPEHPFPTPLDDAYRAYLWLVENAAQFGVDAANLSIGGASAGGNLAAALAIKLRDSGAPRPVLQLLEVPAVDLTLATVKHTAATTDGQEMHGELDEAVGRYLPSPELAQGMLASPLRADDLSALPPAVIFTAEYDPLRTEGERYAERLREANVAARVVQHPGALHGTAMLTRTWEPAAEWQRQASDELRAAHWLPKGPSNPRPGDHEASLALSRRSRWRREPSESADVRSERVSWQPKLATEG